MKKSVIVFAAAAAVLAAGEKKASPSVIDQLIRDAHPLGVAATPGSLWTPATGMTDLAADLRPRRVNDIVTIIVRDRASAVARGTVSAQRTSEARAGINSIFGNPPGGSRLPRLLDLSSDAKLDGQGETTRETVLNTALSVRVTHVLPNGLLVVEGLKSVRINSEIQTVSVRGLLRPLDVTPVNTVFSDQLAELEIAVNGRGVVGDAIRRPNILYRILLGILPF